MSSIAPPTFLDRYEPWRRTAEAGFWILFFCVNAAANSVTVWLDIQRVHLNFQPWEPAAWEWSSNLVLLALVPAIVAFERRFPLNLEEWRLHWPAHLAFSVAVSV